jgi:6-phosphogluconolactonase
VPLPPAQIHRIEGERGDAAAAADAYAAALSRAFALVPGAWPVFDLVLLGVGPDGHTASLFPHTAALDVVDRVAAAAIAPAAPTSRVTLTYPVLNAARAVVVLVSGADKADAVARAFDDDVPVADCPVRGVRPAAGSLTWHLDADAASKLRGAFLADGADIQ